MNEEKILFGMLDDISANQVVFLNEITGVKNQVDDSTSRINELEKELQDLKTQSSNNPAKSKEANLKENEIICTFLKQSKKSWRWFGNSSEFNKHKKLAFISMLIMLIIGVASTITTSVCFKIYSTFTFFENIWMIFGIIYLVYISKTKLIYEVNELSTNSSFKYETDKLGMKFQRKEKLVFRIFRWIAIISIICNVIAIWAGLGKGNQILATILELLYLASIVFAFFINLNLYAQYSIIWLEGYKIGSNEKAILVLPTGAKHFILEEEFKKKMPFFYK
ncbi:MAG: hypothetical protein MR467_06150 [Bacillales bacterium]|nr:hypothetical protein [Mollicutes bacterium]MCI7213703.1 hypothetical protein [Bacillales bacterium]